MKSVKRFIRQRIRNSSTAMRILAGLYDVAMEEENELKNGGTAAAGSQPAPVVWPLVKEYQYNKRISNYLLEKDCSYQTRRWVMEQMYYKVIGRFPNLDNPRSLNEKMQWMRIHYHDPLMTRCVDKCSFKDYIRETVDLMANLSGRALKSMSLTLFQTPYRGTTYSSPTVSRI